MGSHGEDGSRTPGRSGAWDPTVSNTPAQPGSFDNYDFDETSPSPNYNPGTPEPQVTALRVVDPTPRLHLALPIIPRTILPINHLLHHTRVPHLPKVMFQLLPLQEAALISHHHPLVMLLRLPV